MHTVDVLEQAVFFAERLGYRIRQEWLGGEGGGGCEFAGHKWIFIDLAKSALEQLEQVLDVLQEDPQSARLTPPVALRKLMTARQAAFGARSQTIPPT